MVIRFVCGVAIMSNAADIQRDLERATTEDDATTATVRELLKHVHTAIPGIISSFNAATQTATVRPALRRIWVDLGPVEIPPCVDVPVYFPAGGGFVLTFPVAAGDECLLCFSERAIDNWYANGGIQDPSEYRLHDYSDGFAFVGFASKPNAIPLLSTDGAELRTRDGATVFRLEAGTAYVGGKIGAEPPMRGQTYRQGQVTMHQELLAALQIVAAAPTGPSDSAFVLAVKALIPIWVAAIETFEAGAAGYLAQKAKVF